MTSGSGTVERLTWMVAVAVLATSLCWLAAIDAVVLAHRLGAEYSAAWVLIRALGKSAVVLLSHAWPTLVAAAVGVAFLWTLFHAPRREETLSKSVPHAR